MLDKLNAWFYLGVEAEPSYTLKRKIYYSNVAALVAIVSLLSFVSGYIVSDNAALIEAAYIDLVFCFPLILVPWMNRHGWSQAARWTLFIDIMLCQLVVLYGVIGSYLNAHYYFILLAIIPAAFFPLRQWWAVALLFLANAGCFLTFEFYWFEPDAALNLLDLSVVNAMRTANTAGAFLTLLLFVVILEWLAERNELRLERLSLLDVLTELPNRRHFEATYEREVAQARRSGLPLSIAMLDIDHFKIINDNHGHDVGDEVLKYVASCLRSVTRGGSFVARIGGEEFVILFPDSTLQQAAEAAERVRNEVQSGSYQYQGQKVEVTVSIGVAAVDPKMPEESAKLADDALYSAKRRGRNRVVALTE